MEHKTTTRHGNIGMKGTERRTSSKFQSSSKKEHLLVLMMVVSGNGILFELHLENHFDEDNIAFRMIKGHYFKQKYSEFANGLRTKGGIKCH